MLAHPKRNKTDSERRVAAAEVRQRFRYWLLYRFTWEELPRKLWFESAQDRDAFVDCYMVIVSIGEEKEA